MIPGVVIGGGVIASLAFLVWGAYSIGYRRGVRDHGCRARTWEWTKRVYARRAVSDDTNKVS